MSDAKRYLAIDLGAESGRAVIGTLADDKLSIEEIHRFPTQGVVILGRRQWEVARLWREILASIKKYTRNYGSELASIGVDTWGVDFGLVASDGQLLANPVHYRDKRTEGMMSAAFALAPREEIYETTGIQFLPFNTIYQLFSMVRSDSPLLKVAETFLMMPDIFHYFLTGRRACEFSNATTTQLYDPRRGKWADDLFKRLGIPRRIMPEILMPGSALGTILPEVADATGLAPATRVILPATHDTGSAVAAVPTLSAGNEETPRWAYISSGTWSLMGAELSHPLINRETLEYNFTNEGGFGGTFRFLKNIIGLWLVQECRRAWERLGETLSYDEITARAESAEPFVSLINPDDAHFLNPASMPDAICSFCRETGQVVPQTKGAIVRCALESLALKYRVTLEEIEKLLGVKIQTLHIVGGGVQNRLLMQCTANACGVPVMAGPVEATAIGNIIVQAIGAGDIGSLAEARALVSRSFKVKQFAPDDAYLKAWTEAKERFSQIAEKNIQNT